MRWRWPIRAGSRPAPTTPAWPWASTPTPATWSTPPWARLPASTRWSSKTCSPKRAVRGGAPRRGAARLAGEPALVDGVFGRVRRAGVQHFEFLAAVGVGDHGHGQVRARGQADGQVAEPGRGETFGLVPDLLGFRAGQDRLADGDHAYYLPVAPAGRPHGM